MKLAPSPQTGVQSVQLFEVGHAPASFNKNRWESVVPMRFYEAKESKNELLVKQKATRNSRPLVNNRFGQGMAGYM